MPGHGAEGVTFHGDEVRNGEFERIQAFCVEHGLHDVLTHDGCGGEWGPARRSWRPSDAEAVTCPLDADSGSARITADEIRRAGFASVAAIFAHLSEFNDEVCPPLVLVVD